MGNFTWFMDCTAKNAKVNLHAIVTELKDNLYFDRFEDLLSKKYNYSKKMEILRNPHFPGASPDRFARRRRTFPSC